MLQYLVELLEYALVVLASTSIIAFSAFSYSSYTSSVELAAQRANYSSYVTLAYVAVERGNSSASLTLVDTSLTCDAGRLGFSSAVLSDDSMLPVLCHFAYLNLAGSHELKFVYRNGFLALELG
jgi:hypothetical protein